MTTLARSLGRIVLVVLLALAFAGAPSAYATGTTTGPVVILDSTEVNPGDQIGLTIDGFTVSSVTISVCGNEARRGSSDCNMAASEGQRLNPDGTPTPADMPVAAPPVDCPCVIRVSDRSNNEVAVTPITIIGHPIGPVVDPPKLGTPLAVTISAEPSSRGLLELVRPSLGGPATYDVTVTVKNISMVPFSSVRVSGSAGRNPTDNLAMLKLSDPGLIGPGQTWQEIVPAVVPAPSFGTVRWRVAVSGAGPTVNANESTHYRPLLLIVLAMFLVADIFLLIIRGMVRRRKAREAADDVDGKADGSGNGPFDQDVASADRRDLVGAGM